MGLFHKVTLSDIQKKIVLDGDYGAARDELNKLAEKDFRDIARTYKNMQFLEEGLKHLVEHLKAAHSAISDADVEKGHLESEDDRKVHPVNHWLRLAKEDIAKIRLSVDKIQSHLKPIEKEE